MVVNNYYVSSAREYHDRLRSPIRLKILLHIIECIDRSLPTFAEDCGITDTYIPQILTILE